MRLDHELPPFNPRARCPKCIYDCVSTTYNDGLDFYRSWASIPWGSEKDDEKNQKHAESAARMRANAVKHLARKCLRCGWAWKEACEPESVSHAS